MSNRDEMYIYAFNELGRILEHGDTVNWFCHSKSDCEYSIKHINSIVKRMNELLEEMEG